MPLTPDKVRAFLKGSSARPTTPGKPEPSQPASGGSLTDYQGLSAEKLVVGEAGQKVRDTFGGGQEDFLVPTIAVPRGDHAGKLGIDIASMRKGMATARLNKKIEAYRAKAGTSPDTEWVKAWRKYETNQAHNEIMEWNREQRGTAPDSGLAAMASRLWVDTDEGGGRAELAEQLAGQFLAPIKASVMGVSQTTYDGAKAESYNEGDFWGGLDYWGRFQASTYLATAAKAADVKGFEFLDPRNLTKLYDVWGSKEHLEQIQKGEDVVSLADDLDLGDMNPVVTLVGKGLEAAGLITPETTQAASDFTAGLALAIIDPFDLFFLGKVYQMAAIRGGDVLHRASDAAGLTVSAVAKSQRKASALQKAADDMAAIGQDASKGFRIGDAQKAIKASRDALNKETGALSWTVELLTKTRLATSAPVSAATQRAFKAASDFKQLANEKFGETLGEAAAATAARISEPKGAKGRAKMSPAETVEALQLAKLDHFASEMLYMDLQAQMKAMRMLTQRQEAVATTPGAVGKVSAAWSAALDALHVAREGLATAADPAAFKAAEEVFDVASATYQRHAFDASLIMGAKAEQKLANMVDSARTAAEAHKADMVEALALASKHDPEAVKAVKAHIKTLGSLKKQGQAWRDRSAVTMYQRSAQDLAEGYRRLAGHANPADATGDLAAMARDTERIATAMAHTELGGGITGVIRREAMKWTEAVAHIINPAVRATGSESEAVQLVSSTTENMVSHVKQDLLRLGEGGVSEVEAIARMTQYITTNAQLGKGVHKTTFNTIGEVPLWEEALPILRNAAQGGQGSAHALEALTNMWFPSGVNMKPFQAKISKKVKELLLSTADATMSWEQFSAEVYKVTKHASGINDKRLMSDALRATANGVQGVVQAALLNKAGRRITQLVGALDPSTMSAVENISLGLGHLAGDQYLQAMHVFDVLNIPSAQRKFAKTTLQQLEAGLVHLGGESLKAAAEAMNLATEALAKAKTTKQTTKATAELATAKKAYALAAADSTLIPRTFMKRLDDRFTGIVKSADAFTERPGDPLTALANAKLSQLARLWNTSLLTGLILPRPTYFTNIFVGNFAQMWVEVGVGAALRVTSQTLGYLPLEAAHHIPYLGRGIDLARETMAKNLGVGVDGVLPSVMQTLFNPHLARFYDEDLAKGTDKVGGKFYAAMEWKEARRHVFEQGITTSFVGAGSDLQNLLARTDHYTQAMTFWQKAGEKASYLRNAYTDIADTVEQRQRVALFLDLMMRKGMTPDQAGRKVRDALYDWAAPLTDFEKQWITKVFMFWNFSRKAMGQGFRNLTSAFVNDEGASAIDQLIKTSSPASMVTGRTPYSTTRLTDMYRTVAAGKEFMRTVDQEEPDPLNAVYPWWMKDTGTMTPLTNAPMNEAQVDYNATLGRKLSHRALVMPSFTPMEYSSFWVDLMRMAVAAPFNEDVTALDALKEVGMHTIAAHGGKLTGPALESAINEATGSGKMRFASDSVKVNKLADRAILGGFQSAFGRLGYANFVYEDKDDPGMVRVNRQAWAMYKAALPISHEVVNWLDPLLENAATRAYAEEHDIDPEEMKRGIGWMTRQITGVGKEYYHSPEETLKYDQTDLKRKAGLQTNEAKRRKITPSR